MPEMEIAIATNDRGARIAREWLVRSGEDNVRRSSSSFRDNEGGAAPDTWDDKVATFVAVAEQRRTRLLSLAQRMTDCREDAEDIVQLALMKAYANLSGFRGESKMATWLHMIVQNTAREWLRNRRGRVYLPLECTAERDEGPMVLDFPDPGRNPEEHCRDKEIETMLHSEIDGLTVVCRRAIQMCFLEELSQVAAANAMNVSVLTIKSRVFRGKQMLRQALHLHARGAEHRSLPSETVT
jgi:RNA polymerase sigma-70 factor (ECF subfamily)